MSRRSLRAEGASFVTILVSGCGAAWLARLTGGQEVAGSNPASPTRDTVAVAQVHPLELVTRWASRPLFGHYEPIKEAKRSTASRCIPGNTDE